MTPDSLGQVMAAGEELPTFAGNSVVVRDLAVADHPDAEPRQASPFVALGSAEVA